MCQLTNLQWRLTERADSLSDALKAYSLCNAYISHYCIWNYQINLPTKSYPRPYCMHVVDAATPNKATAPFYAFVFILHLFCAKKLNRYWSSCVAPFMQLPSRYRRVTYVFIFSISPCSDSKHNRTGNAPLTQCECNVNALKEPPLYSGVQWVIWKKHLVRKSLRTGKSIWDILIIANQIWNILIIANQIERFQ